MRKLSLRIGLPILAAMVGLAAASCADHIGRAELLEQIDRGTAPPIVDLRTRGEFESGHVPGAVHIPFYSILAGFSDLPEPAEEGQPVVVYCEHGPRAGMARAQLWFVTDRPILFLDGHMMTWKDEGLRVERVDEQGLEEVDR